MDTINPLSDEEKEILLKLARQSIEASIRGLPLPEINLENYSQNLRQNGATFVTLTLNGNLRGCIGTLEAYQSLVQDVCEHAIAAAQSDYRFPPVSLNELPYLEIEISRLTPPEKIEYDSPEELPELISPGKDGIIFRDGFKKATFLPQVWDKLPEYEQFFSHLCQKMGASADLWKRKVFEVYIYQVEEFSEKK